MGDPAQSILYNYNSVCLSICQGLWQPELTHTGTNYSYRFLNEHIMKSTCFIFFSLADHFQQADFSLLYQLSVPGACRAADELTGMKSHTQESCEHKALTLLHRQVNHEDDFFCFWIRPIRTLGLIKHPRKCRWSCDILYQAALVPVWASCAALTAKPLLASFVQALKVKSQHGNALSELTMAPLSLGWGQRHPYATESFTKPKRAGPGLVPQDSGLGLVLYSQHRVTAKVWGSLGYFTKKLHLTASSARSPQSSLPQSPLPQSPVTSEPSHLRAQLPQSLWRLWSQISSEPALPQNPCSLRAWVVSQCE